MLGSIIGCYLELDGTNMHAYYTINGSKIVKAFQMPWKSNLVSYMVLFFFLHINNSCTHQYKCSKFCVINSKVKKLSVLKVLHCIVINLTNN